MRRLLLSVLVFALMAVGASRAGAVDISKLDAENLLFMELKTGRVVIMMRPSHAPKTVARIKELVRDGFYDGLTFHRVIEGFMAQTGDPEGDGTGGSGEELAAEFNDLPHMRGTVSMAREADDPDSADSQFFIMLAPHFSLDGEYTVWGRVIEGMAHVDAIKKGDPEENGKVADPDRIIRMRVAADVLAADGAAASP